METVLPVLMHPDDGYFVFLLLARAQKLRLSQLLAPLAASLSLTKVARGGGEEGQPSTEVPPVSRHLLLARG